MHIRGNVTNKKTYPIPIMIFFFKTTDTITIRCIGRVSIHVVAIRSTF